MELESKAFGIEPQGQEVKKAFEDFLGNFEAFKQNNDERLKGIEKRSADVLLDEKVDRINKALESQQRNIDTLLLEAARPALGGERKSFDPRGLEKKQAFDRYVRKGEGGGMDMLEAKAMNAGVNTAGGYTVPLEIERTIDHVLGKASPIRSIAPGQPDDAASDVGLSEAIALLAGNLGAARLNALQLEHLQAVMASPEP